MVADCAPWFQSFYLYNMPKVFGLFCNSKSLSVLSPAYPAFSLLFCPHPPSRREGGDYKFILPGASPQAPRHQTVYGTDSPCRCNTPEGACPLGRLPPLPLVCFSAPFPEGEG